MKQLLMVFGLFFTLTAGQAVVQEESVSSFNVPVKSLKEGEKGFVHPDSVSTGHLTVVPMSIKGFDGAKGDKINSALRLLEDVVNSDEFKSRVINFVNTKGTRAFASNKNLTNEQIYAQFMEGRETLQPNTPNEMNYYLALYNKPWSRVIGYTDGSINQININWKYFKGNEISDVAANLAHEWTHKIGFDHKSAAEHDSAPYAIGYIVGDIARARLSAGLH